MTPRPLDRLDLGYFTLEVVPAVAGMVMLLLVAACLPFMGFAAAESLDGQKLYGILEGDWMFLFGLIAAGTCIAGAIRRFRRVLGVCVFDPLGQVSTVGTRWRQWRTGRTPSDHPPLDWPVEV